MENDTGLHYRKEYKGIKLDPARICLIYEVNNMAQASIIKKALNAGKRGRKDTKTDILDIITAANRWLEMIEEDENNE